MKLQGLFAIATAAATLLVAGIAAAQQPIKVGMSMPQTGPLGAWRRFRPTQGWRASAPDA